MIRLGPTRKRDHLGDEVECLYDGHYSRLLFIWRKSTCFRGAINLQGKSASKQCRAVQSTTVGRKLVRD